MQSVHKVIQLLLKSPKFAGRDYLIEQLPSWLIKRPTGPVLIKTIFGFKIHLDPTFDKNIENIIFERGVYEQGTVAILKQFLKSGDTFIDAGANIGFLSLIAAKTVGSMGEVHAFEPFPSTFEILEKNKNVNQYEQIRLYPYALGSISENKVIYTEKENRGGASLVNHLAGKGTEISVKKLDDVLVPMSVDVIKIDVEGYEFEVLKGAEETIRRNRPKLIIEYSVDRNNTATSDTMIAWLQNLDIYKFYKLKHGKERASVLLEIKNKSDLPAHDNIFCIPI